MSSKHGFEERRRIRGTYHGFIVGRGDLARGEQSRANVAISRWEALVGVTGCAVSPRCFLSQLARIDGRFTLETDRWQAFPARFYSLTECAGRERVPTVFPCFVGRFTIETDRWQACTCTAAADAANDMEVRGRGVNCMYPGSLILIINAGNGHVSSFTSADDGSLANGEFHASIDDVLMVTINDPFSNTLSFKRSRFVAEDGTTGIGPSGGVVRDADGNRDESTDERGVTWRYAYDEQNRIREARIKEAAGDAKPTGPIRSYRYLPVGLLETETDNLSGLVTR